jgi:hypothetical protein
MEGITDNDLRNADPGSIGDFLNDLWRLPEGIIFGPNDATLVPQYFETWGFTIYRTHYGPGSEEQWCRLLQTMHAGAQDGIENMWQAEDYPAIMSKSWDLFRLDARSDADTLDGLTLENVRQVYVDKAGGAPMPNVPHRHPWHVFFLADAEVLRDPDLRMIKVVAAEYDAERAVPKNRRYGPQRYFGWITMPATATLNLWRQLDDDWLMDIGSRIMPCGGPGAFWNPDND